jgi:hypothetical protein
MLNNFYLALGSALLLGYTVVAFNGYEYGDAQRLQAGADYRSNSSYRHGYTTFWGFRGGK